MEVRVLNTDFSDDGVLDIYESFIWTDRYNKCGDFEIYSPVTNDMLTKLEKGKCLQIKDSEHTMIIENVKIETDIEDGDKVIITGRSLESILERRVVWGQKAIDDTLQNGIEILLNENVISPTIAERTIPNFIFKTSTDTNITSLLLKAQYVGNNLYEEIIKMCESENIGFKILVNDGSLEFELYSGKDRTYDQIVNPWVIFSPDLDNLLTSDYYQSDVNLRNISLVGGEGEGSNRKMATAGDEVVSGLERREIFTDASSLSQTVDGVVIPEADYLLQLEKKGITDLSDKKKIETFDAEIEPSSYVYGIDYGMGDIVQIENEYGMKSKSRVTEYIISQSTTGYKVYPTFTKIEE